MGIETRKEDFEVAVYRALTDAAFRRFLMDDIDCALASYYLSADDVQLISTTDWEGLAAQSAERATRVDKR